VTFDSAEILAEPWNEAKAKLALATLYVCVIKYRHTENPVLENLKLLPDEQQKIVERALATMCDGGMHHSFFKD
jgi:hypothetical protein